ncbi:MAG: ABC transporter ATP-binding protein [Candidatus Daviesbacteria bacterium]|nr:ABC transporter ATP-binding protein [Candidatus Daviesbacteria bacterium]
MNKEILEIANGFKHAWKLLDRSEKVLLTLSSLLTLAVGFLTNIPALILGKLVDQVIVTDSFSFITVLPYLLLILFIILIKEGLTIGRKYLVHDVTTQTEKKQTVKVISHLLQTDITELSAHQIGSLHGRVFRSIAGFIQIIKLTFMDLLPTTAAALGAVVIALTQKPLLGFAMLLVIPVGVFIIFKQISSQKGIRVFLIRGKEKIDGAVVEMLGGIETIRSLNTAHFETLRIEKISEDLRQKEIKHHLDMSLYDGAKYLNDGFFYILVIALAIFLASLGVITKGDILVYAVLFTSITGPLREIHRIIDHAHESSIRINDLTELLEKPQDESFKATLESTVDDSSRIIVTRNLSFTYPGGEEVLKNINLAIEKGQKIGIAGASGCGKSTFIKILLRLIHGFNGEVLIFGKDLKTISRQELSAKIAYIPQSTYLFSGTIRENIVYGNEASDDREIAKAAKLANIWDETLKSLGGLDGKVSERGSNLSGGQRQRLALARLILQSPEILIFDEATSALDNTNEAIVLKNLEEIFKDKTIIMIAHRLTTLKNCHRILVFDKGLIVQEGNFKDLSQQEGLFKKFLEQRSV